MRLLTLEASLLALAASVVAVGNGSYTNETFAANGYASSPPFYPSPYGGRLHDTQWAYAYEKARAIVDQLTITEKVNLTTGMGLSSGPCSGNTGSVPRLGIESFCLQDGPLSVRSVDLTTVFPDGVSTAQTWNRKLIYDRAVALGAEFKGKGIDVMFGPVYGPLGVKAQGGRNWEGFGPDPYIEGVAAYLSTLGIQSQGVISNAKHFIGNEQEHYRLPKADRNFGYWDNKLVNNTKALSAEIDDRAMHELYLWPFAEASRAGLASVMCSCNAVNGSSACQNSYILNYLLKEELGFQGFVVSDWSANRAGVDSALAGLDMDMPGEPEHFGGNLTLATLNGSLPTTRLDDMVTRILAAKFFVGVNNPGGPNYDSATYDTYGHQFYNQGEGAIVQLNDHADVRSEFSYLTSLRTAIESIVLLKNEEEALPLQKSKDKRLLLLGQAGGNDPSGTQCSLAGCAVGAVGTGYGSGSGTYTYFVTPAEGVQLRAKELGVATDFVSESWNLDVPYAAVSKGYDAAVVFANSVSGEEIGFIEDNAGDLRNLSLWHNAENLIKNVSSVNNNTIVVITAAGQIDLEPFIENENITAVIISSYLGQDTGTALASILFGDENPSGKLAFTIAKNTSDYIPIITYTTNPEPVDPLYEYSIFTDYKFFDKFDKEVRYEFGYGLSYSNFSLSDLSIKQLQNFTKEIEDELVDYKDVYTFQNSSLNAEDYVYPDGFTKVESYTYPYINSPDQVNTHGNYPYPEGFSNEQLQKPFSKAAGGLGGNPRLFDNGYTVSAKVTNEGDYDGAFAAQLYVAFPDTEEFPAPKVQLRGFDKVYLAPGQTRPVTFELTRKDLSVWDTKTQQWLVQRGDYKIYVASTSRALELVDTITLK